jgi:coiled-coil domain-containing protein 130
MPKRARSECIFQRQSTLFDVNAISAPAGLKYRRTQRCRTLLFAVVNAHCMQNTRYVVTSGARQKEEDWNPEENGGFAVHGTLKFGSGMDASDTTCRERSQ